MDSAGRGIQESRSHCVLDLHAAAAVFRVPGCGTESYHESCRSWRSLGAIRFDDPGAIAPGEHEFQGFRFGLVHGHPVLELDVDDPLREPALVHLRHPVECVQGAVRRVRTTRLRRRPSGNNLRPPICLPVSLGSPPPLRRPPERFRRVKPRYKPRVQPFKRLAALSNCRGSRTVR